VRYEPRRLTPMPCSAVRTRWRKVSEKWEAGADDALWRRPKSGLRYTPAQREQVMQWRATCMEF